MKKLEILIGPIASGKSTYCTNAAKKGAIIVNDDAIVTMIHGGIYELYKKELKPLYKIVENNIIQMGLALNQHVIIDRPNYSVNMRRRYIGLARSLDASIFCIVFPDHGAEFHAQKRFNHDSRGLSLSKWLEVTKRHEKLSEKPDLFAENLDDIIWV